MSKKSFDCAIKRDTLIDKKKMNGEKHILKLHWILLTPKLIRPAREKQSCLPTLDFMKVNVLLVKVV